MHHSYSVKRSEKESLQIMQGDTLDGQPVIVSLSDGRSLVFRLNDLLTLSPVEEWVSDGVKPVCETKG